jgi:threonine synthase
LPDQRFRLRCPVPYDENLTSPVDPLCIISLGEGGTPCVDITGLVPGWDRGTGARCLAKLEFLAPTGSFKDRGSSTMVSRLKELGVTRAIEDSSGNAGASVAAYCAAAGIACEIYVPASASAGKLAQVEAYGAHLVRVPGSREDATRAAVAAVAAAGPSACYASHNRHPYFLAGMKTYAYEVFAEFGDTVGDLLFPTGGGSLLLGAYYGYRDLTARGKIRTMPRLWAVQALACAPIVRAWEAGESAPAPVAALPTAAEGIAVARPPRGAEVLAALRRSGGGALAVTEAEIAAGHQSLAAAGLYVEVTTGVVLAGLRVLVARQGAGGGRAGDPARLVVIPLTGSGLKTPRQGG